MNKPAETYNHNRLLPCPEIMCGATNIRVEIILNEDATVHVHIRCRCCGFKVNQDGKEPFRALSEAFGNWNRQIRRAVA